MQRTSLVALGLVGLVAVAGCNAFSGWTDTAPETPPVTPMDVPTDAPTATPIPRLAPGVTRYGLVNASALMTAHTALLANTSFTVRSTWTLTYPNGTVAARLVETDRIGDDGKRASTMTSTNLPAPSRKESWQNGDRGVALLVTNNSTSYDRFRRSQSNHRALPTYTHVIRTFATTFDPQETTVTTLTRNGTTLYRLEGTSQHSHSNVTMRVLIDARGLIHRATIRKPIAYVPVPHATRAISDIQFTDVGATTVDRPRWYAEAINETTPVNKTTATPTTTG